ncbi:hypothetical protein [Desulfobacula toluolica]|uniref:Uncharacterized protein n=1 Tax=Desulfobacula toluolica (strain DSM 7467 / Tol2) TaxID=651182 RepID=K0NAQ8_DESTT|nr:hypothetical protein [Desulfobacula toluolica]CCK81219.1 uncharacterized protein TOL2_C30600 [Desulfobacula toluolica Tol2]
MKNLIYKTEPEYCTDIKKALSKDFELLPEETIHWPIEGETKRVDFIIHPKAHLIKHGFDAEKIAIEVKSPINKNPEAVKKLLDCISQAHSYTMCKHNGEYIDFVLIYPAIELFFEYDFIYKYKSDPRNKYTRQEINLLHRVLQRANIGSLKINQESYQINFAGTRFYSPEKGRSKIKNLGKIRRIGSQKIILK